MLRFLPSGRMVASPSLGTYLHDGSRLASVLDEYEDSTGVVFDIPDELFADLVRRIQARPSTPVRTGMPLIESVDLVRAWYDFARSIMHDDLTRLVKQHLHKLYREIFLASATELDLRYIFACPDECAGCVGNCSRGHDTLELPMVRKLANLFVPLFHRSPHLTTRAVHDYLEPRSRTMWADFVVPNDVDSPMDALVDVVEFRAPGACVKDSARTVESLRRLVDAFPELLDELRAAIGHDDVRLPLVEASVLLQLELQPETLQKYQALMHKSLYPEVCALVECASPLERYCAGMRHCNTAMLRTLGEWQTLATTLQALHEIYILKMRREYCCAWMILDYVDADLASDFFVALERYAIGEALALRTFAVSKSPDVMSAVLKKTSLRPQTDLDLVTMFQTLGADSLREITAKHLPFYEMATRSLSTGDLPALVLCKASYLLAPTPVEAIEVYSGLRQIDELDRFTKYYAYAPFAFQPEFLRPMLLHLKKAHSQLSYAGLWSILVESVRRCRHTEGPKPPFPNSDPAFDPLQLSWNASDASDESRRWHTALEFCKDFPFALRATRYFCMAVNKLLGVDQVTDDDWKTLGKIFRDYSRDHFYNMSFSTLKKMLVRIMPRMSLSVEDMPSIWLKNTLKNCSFPDGDKGPPETDALAVLQALEKSASCLIGVPAWTSRLCKSTGDGRSVAVLRRVLSMLPDHATGVMDSLVGLEPGWLSGPLDEAIFALAQEHRVNWQDVQLPHPTSPHQQLRRRLLALRRRHKRSRE